MNYKIRKFQLSDEEKLKPLIKDFKIFEGQYEEAFRVDSKAVDELYNLEIIGDGKYTYVCELDSKIVGFISFQESTKNDPLITDPIKAVYIVGLFVAEEHRGKGIAKDFIKIAEDFAKEKNIKFLKLIMFDKNQLAKNFYVKSGFENYEVTMVKELM